MVWAGTSGMAELRSAVDKAIDGDDLSPILFETYLAAVETLDPRFLRAVAERLCRAAWRPT